MMFQRLYQNAVGSKARLIANFQQLGCASSFPMQRWRFAALVAPAASFGCEVWGVYFQGTLSLPAGKLRSVQAAYLRGLCSLPKSGSLAPIFAEVGEEAWDMQWGRRVCKFGWRLGQLPISALHREILMMTSVMPGSRPATGPAADVRCTDAFDSMPRELHMQTSCCPSPLQPFPFASTLYESPSPCPAKPLLAASRLMKGQRMI